MLTKLRSPSMQRLVRTPWGMVVLVGIPAFLTGILLTVILGSFDGTLNWPKFLKMTFVSGLAAAVGSALCWYLLAKPIVTAMDQKRRD